MRVLIAGPRCCTAAASVAAQLDEVFHADKPAVVIHGVAAGVDTFADKWARANEIERMAFPVKKADWARYGLAAGPIRNKRMLEEGQPDLLVAFKYRDRRTPGTEDMIRQARKANVPVRIITL